MDNVEFRKAFPAFFDEVIFNNDRLDFWANLAELRLSKDRFGDVYDYAVMLFVAHNLALQQNYGGQGLLVGSSAGSSVSPKPSGSVSQKKVGDVSISYDASHVMSSKAGSWNETIYGIQLQELMRLYSAGGYQL